MLVRFFGHNDFGPLFKLDSDGSGGGSSDSADNDADGDVTDDIDEGDEEDDEDDEEEEPAKEESSPEASFQNLMKRFNNNAQAVAEHLFRTSWRVRASRRLLKDEVVELKKRLPRNGSVTLSKQEYADFKAYKAFGTPKDVRTNLAAKNDLQARVEKADREQTIARVARVSRLNADVLSELGGKLSYVIKSVGEGDDKTEEAYIVETVDGVKQETPVTDYAKRKWKVFMPALTARNARRDADNEDDYDTDEIDSEDDDSEERQTRVISGRGNAARMVQQPAARDASKAKKQRGKTASGYIASRYGRNDREQ